MPSYVVTGGNRGLGCELVRQLISKDTNIVIATTRSPSKELSVLAESHTNLHILELDVSDPTSLPTLLSAISRILGPSSKLDYLLNNAGINPDGDDALHLDPYRLHQCITTNVQTPAEVVKHLLPHLQRGSIVMNMTSGVSSLYNMKAQAFNVGAPYAISKAALNMLTVMQARSLREKGVVVICMDPGHVKTDMGGDEAPLEPPESIAGVLKVLAGLTEEDTAKFYQFDGKEVPW